MRVLVVLALLLSITPGATELVETAVHAIVHGDLPHHDGDEASRNGSEHACTALAHHCGCHATMFAQVASRCLVSAGSMDETRVGPAHVMTASGRSCEPPPLRPPIG